MSYTFGLTVESLVAILLLLTILYCARLNKQIGRLKADESAMKASIAELMAATEKAERAIAGLRLTASDAGEMLNLRLREAEGASAAITEHLRAGEDLLNRLRKIAYANKLLSGDAAEPKAAAAPAPAAAPKRAEPDPSAHDAKAVAAAAQAFAERARARAAHGRAA